MAICTLHVVSTISVFREAWDMLPRWSSWLARWGVPGLRNSEPTESGFWTILFILGSHEWLSAVGWDVVFSVFSLCAWAIVSRADVRGMLKCGFWPWLDESIKALHDSAGGFQEAAEPYLEAMQDNIELLQEQAEPYTTELRRRTKKAKRKALPYLDTARDYVEEGLGHGAEYAKNALSKAAGTIPQLVGGEVGDAAGPEGRCVIIDTLKKRGRPPKGTRKPSQSPAPTRESSRRASSRTAIQRQSSPPRRRSSRI